MPKGTHITQNLCDVVVAAKAVLEVALVTARSCETALGCHKRTESERAQHSDDYIAGPRREKQRTMQVCQNIRRVTDVSAVSRKLPGCVD